MTEVIDIAECSPFVDGVVLQHCLWKSCMGIWLRVCTPVCPSLLMHV